ncbi:transglycosylase domain-containing protein [Metabacillus indicus]|uniref:Penicillin-binding protein n=1 Tax=Metabacillus indicus TaxID=246786 RepID=A0A084GJ83_METID|nr:PBP1A family penicillin-binding protein [Metabacillus indicus]KEZ47094.1 penicillin-binding protein [Metabacillus indicus LMG 22858]KEZ47395.1 penicillin-binding protein [Metabacillus indicus]
MRKKVILSALAALLTAIIALAVYLLILVIGDYSIDEKKLVMDSTTTLVDPEGSKVAELYLQNREPVSVKDIPVHVREAFIAVEDKRFYEHNGIDLKAISRALYRDFLAGGKVEGGSTITQQLAKNTFLTSEKSVLRKVKEAAIAMSLENKYSKSKLLELYLNQVYFGHGAYGIQSASLYYFNKEVKDLTVEEGAMLAGIPKAPSNYSPVLHPDRSKERRDTILSLMGDQGYLTAEEVVRSQGRTLGLSISEESETPWLISYIDMVMDEAEERYNLSNEELMRGGYTVTVPLDAGMQKTAYELFQKDAYFPGTTKGAEGAFVLIDNKTGGVKAAIGGRNYVQKGYNRVTTKRQPGSTFKPIAVYAPAMEEEEFGPYSLLEDKPVSYDGYQPKNNDRKYDEEVTMYDAITASKNAPAVWTLNEMGVSTSKKYLEKSGLPIEDNGLSIALGGLKNGVTPLQMANAYRAFAQYGVYSEPYFIQKITDRDAKEVSAPEHLKKRIFSAQTAWNMTRMLEEVVNEGTASIGTYDGVLAGKTGTTSFTDVDGAVKDAWFVGYTPSVSGALWMGYDRTDSKQYLKQGSSYPTRLFKEILSESGKDLKTAFQMPDGVEDLEEPIRLKNLGEVKAGYTFKALGLFTVTLKWDAQKDDRVIYRIYETSGSKDKLVGFVKGEDSYEIPYSNLFSNAEYKVVPYNEQTDQEGEGSDPVKPELFTSGL